jgi:hypothetical protein
MGVHLRRECRLCVLIYFDFFGVSVGYFHAFCLDLLTQNADHIALVVLPVLPFPVEFMGRTMSGPASGIGKADPAFLTRDRNLTISSF